MMVDIRGGEQYNALDKMISQSRDCTEPMPNIKDMGSNIENNYF